MELTGAGALVRSLAAHGVGTVFGIPGTHNLSIYAALAQQGIRHISTCHEQGAGFAADGWARVTGQPGVCVTTTGPGVLNTATAMAQAYSDSVPVLLVSPGLPSDHPAAGNGYLHEVKDQTAAMAAVTAYSHRVTSVREIPSAVAEAFVRMTSGRPRPVHLEVPVDLLEQTAVVELIGLMPAGRRNADPGQVAKAAEVIDSAVRPLILAGGGSVEASTEVRALAERINALVVTTANGKGVVRTDHPLTVGTGLHQPIVSELLQDSDVIIAIGTELAPSDLWAGPVETAGRLVRFDVDELAIARNARPEVAVIGDATSALRAVLELVAVRPASVAATARARFEVQARAEGAAYLGMVDALGDVLGEDGILAGDSTMACYYGALGNLPAYRPRSFLYPTGLGTLGYGLPAAIGAKLAHPSRTVVALLGDGGIMFTLSELATAARLRLPLPVVVVDNGGYGEIRAEMVDRGEPVHAVDFAAPDFAALGRALGCHGVAVADRGQLHEALLKATVADRPTVIHLPEEAAR